MNHFRCGRRRSSRPVSTPVSTDKTFSSLRFAIIDVIASGDVEAAQTEVDNHLQSIEDKLDLGNERSPGDLYAAFAHVKAKPE